MATLLAHTLVFFFLFVVAFITEAPRINTPQRIANDDTSTSRKRRIFKIHSFINPQALYATRQPRAKKKLFKTNRKHVFFLFVLHMMQSSVVVLSAPNKRSQSSVQLICCILCLMSCFCYCCCLYLAQFAFLIFKSFVGCLKYTQLGIVKKFHQLKTKEQICSSTSVFIYFFFSRIEEKWAEFKYCVAGVIGDLKGWKFLWQEIIFAVNRVGFWTYGILFFSIYKRTLQFLGVRFCAWSRGS